MSEDRATDRIWPPVFRKGHRVETALDMTVLDCEYELLADCLKCVPAEARHKTHLDAADFSKLARDYGAHWLVGFYLEAGWNVEQGICQPCLDDLPNRKASRIILPTRPETKRLFKQVGHRRN